MIIVVQTVANNQLQLSYEGCPPEVAKQALLTVIQEVIDKQINQSRLALPQQQMPSIRDILNNRNGENPGAPA